MDEIEWFLINDNSYIENDFIVFTISFQEEIKTKKLKETNKLLQELKTIYPNKESLEKQIKIDFPRMKCFLETQEMKYSDIHKLNKKLLLLCTQATLFDVLEELFRLFKQEHIHVIDFQEGNHLYFFFQQKHLEIRKMFRIISLEQNQPQIIDTIQVNIFIELNDSIYYSFTPVNI
jgi:hypothetical protein